MQTKTGKSELDTVGPTSSQDQSAWQASAELQTKRKRDRWIWTDSFNVSFDSRVMKMLMYWRKFYTNQIIVDGLNSREVFEEARTSRIQLIHQLSQELLEFEEPENLRHATHK